MGQEIRWKLVQLKGGYHAREIGGKRRSVSLKTKNEEEAKLNFKTQFGEVEISEEAVHHLAMAKAHLNLANPELTEHTFEQLYQKWYGAQHLEPSTRKRRKGEVSRGLFAKIAHHRLCDPKVKAVIEAVAPKLGIYARESLAELQRLAMKLGWILVPLLHFCIC